MCIKVKSNVFKWAVSSHILVTLQLLFLIQFWCCFDANFTHIPSIALRQHSCSAYEFFFCQSETFLIICWFYFQIWAIVVFGCIIAEGWHRDRCQMHGDNNACGYGTGIGILAFIICLVFLVIDALFDNISSVQYRKYVVIADLGISGKY